MSTRPSQPPGSHPPPSSPAQAGPQTPLQAPERPGLDDRERSLAPQIMTSWRISLALSLLFPTSVTTILGFIFSGWWGFAVLGSWVLFGLLLAFWYMPVRYRRWHWQLTDLAVELRYGVLVRQQETVPYFRIQQIDIAQGPLDRLLNLASLQVTTASASGSASLPGIASAEAPQVRAEFLARAAEAVADHPGDLRDAV